MILSVRNLTKRYPADTVLENISFELNVGECASIIGPNASGKSTLLKIIAGIQTPSSGESKADVPISYMPQDHALLPWRTVLGNLYLPSDVRHVSRSEVHGELMSLLTDFGLQQYAHAYPAHLSGGTRQKIALLRTVLHDHSLLLLDEPFAPLDALTRLEAQIWLESLMRKKKTTTLLVTHDIREALFFSDTIYVFDARPGRIKQCLSVPLPHPRRHEQLKRPDILALEAQLFSLLMP